MNFREVVSIELEIDPLKVKNLSRFLDVTETDFCDDEYIYIDVEAIVSGSYEKPKTYGLPEDCYEGHFEYEIEEVLFGDVDITDYLPSKNIEDIEKELRENFNY